MDFSGVDRTREGVSFAKEVAAGSEETLSYEVPNDGTIESIKVRIYPGPQNDLHVTPYVNREGGADSNLVELKGKDHFDGDDDTWSFGLSKDIETGDLIKVQAVNNDANNPYNFRANVEVDYRGGSTSTLAWLFGRGS
jgi:hypothetical protein